MSAWRSLHFATDGTVRTGHGAGASGGGTTAASRTGEVARYRLDGYSIVLEPADGRRERQLFHYVPGSERVLGVGAATRSLRR